MDEEVRREVVVLVDEVRPEAEVGLPLVVMVQKEVGVSQEAGVGASHPEDEVWGRLEEADSAEDEVRLVGIMSGNFVSGVWLLCIDHSWGIGILINMNGIAHVFPPLVHISPATGQQSI